MRRTVVLGALLVGLLGPFWSAWGAECKPSPPQWSEDDVDVDGTYTNCVFGYSIAVPQGLVGRTHVDARPQHGFTLPLSTQPEAHIEVVGEHNSVEWPSSEAMAADRLRLSTESAEQVYRVTTTKALLGEVPAIRQTVVFRCGDQTFVEDSFVAAGRRFDYEVTLYVDEKAYTAWKAVLEELATSFRLVPVC